MLIPLFSAVYGYRKLKRLESENPNNPGINLGDETARVAFQITSKDEQKWVEAHRAIATIQAMAGFGGKAVTTVEVILSNRNWHLSGIAAFLAETGDRENFKQLLIPSAYYPDAAYQMCGHLARLYPERTAAVAQVVSEVG